MSKRLLHHSGEWIDRNKPVRFHFEGQEYTGYEGDTISSALWASGVQALGRSFKYHRPRGIFSLANHDINVMVTDGTDTNIRADVTLITEGMQLYAVNTRGGVLKDKTRFMEWLSPFLPVGFYYKAFHSPKKLFPYWETLIRNLAGLGKVNFDYPRVMRRKTNAHCDVLVIGAGAAGLSAALQAAGAGLEVVLVDENAQAGGSLTYDHAAGSINSTLLSRLLGEVEGHPNITLHTASYAAGYYTEHLVPVVTPHGIIKVRARAVIVASGVFEQPPVFRNNDLPGVMLGTAAQRLVHRYAVAPCRNPVIVTANDHGYRVALDMLAADIKIAAVVDMRPARGPQELHDALKHQGVSMHTGHCVYEALPTADGFGVKGAVVCSYEMDSAFAESERSFTIACDGILMSAGWAPAAALLYQAGTGMRFDNDIQQFVPQRLPVGVFAAGKVNGVFELEQRVNDGLRAAGDAIRYLGLQAAEVAVAAHAGNSPSHPYPIVEHANSRNFIDFDEDLQLKDFLNAAQEGFDNIELMKRFTTVGMGPSQGKHSNMNAIRILARLRNLPVEKVGTTTARPFFHPTPFAHLSGRSFHPHRLTALHGWHAAAGAVFVEAGAWKRPAYYAKEGFSKQQLIEQESLTVRNSAGIIDAGTLGKIEVCGPDAAEFLERFYTGGFASQKIGETRYALLLDESAVVVDDGIAGRLAEDVFYVTASTSNAAAVYREMQRWQQRWQLDIGLVNVTGAFGAMNIAGPRSRDIVQQLTALDLSDAAFPFGAIREAEVAGLPARVLRVGFVAELAFELHIPAAASQSVWDAVMEAGKVYGIRAFGTDTQRLLRLEMGHPISGHDTDGLTNPYEIGAEHAMKMGKTFFVGQRSAQIVAKKTLKKRLVPFILDTGYQGEMPLDCNLVIEPAADSATKGEISGRVTSIAHSPSIARIIGLAYVPVAKTAPGSVFQIRTDSGALVNATVATTPFVVAATAKGSAT
ncbi:MAG: FAD-dependent oxidoreductase [Pseudomonadota bacterium]